MPFIVAFGKSGSEIMAAFGLKKIKKKLALGVPSAGSLMLDSNNCVCLILIALIY